jgi:DNA repair exonuclease SbcCD ATPase subunit
VGDPGSESPLHASFDADPPRLSLSPAHTTLRTSFKQPPAHTISIADLPTCIDVPSIDAIADDSSHEELPDPQFRETEVNRELHIMAEAKDSEISKYSPMKGESEASELRKQIPQLEPNIASLNEENDNDRQLGLTAEQNLRNTERTLEGVQTFLMRGDAPDSKLEEQIRSLEATIVNLRRDRDRAEELRAVAEARASKAEEEAEKARQSLQNERGVSGNDLCRKNEELKADLARRSNELESTTIELQAKTDEVAEVNRQFEVLTKEHACDCRTFMKAYRALQARTDEIRQLRETEAQLSKTLGECRVRSLNHRRSARERGALLSECATELERTKAELEKLRIACAKLSGSAGDAQNQHGDSDSLLQSIIESNQRLELELTNMKSELTRITTDLKAKEEEVQQYKTRIESAERERDSSLMACDQMKASLQRTSDEELKTLTDRIRRNDDSLKQRQRTIDQLESKVSDLEIRLRESEGNRATIITESLKKDDALRIAQNEIRDLNEKVANLASAQVQLQKYLTKYLQDLQERDTLLSEKEKVLGSLRTELEHNRRELDNAQSALVKSSGDAETKELDLNRYQTKIAGLERDQEAFALREQQFHELNERRFKHLQEQHDSELAEGYKAGSRLTK